MMAKIAGALGARCDPAEKRQVAVTEQASADVPQILSLRRFWGKSDRLITRKGEYRPANG
jgi:hypothetical protein